MPTLLITGANRGIGLALCQQYLEHGWSVIATSRSPNKANALNQLKTQYPLLTIHQLDVTNYAQLKQLSATLAPTKINVIINNAGIYGPKNYGFGHCDEAAWRDVFETNAIAPAKLAEAFFTQLKAADNPIFAAISSRVGSHSENTKGGGYLYRSSKAALNSVVKSLSNDLLPLGIKTVSLHPGWVKTDMGGPNALITPEQSAIGLKQVIDNLSEQQSGGFFGYQGEEIPW